jgi:hypothetical protein
MNGKPILYMLARLLDEHGLEAILIGNAAAALQGAPVTTLDFPPPGSTRGLPRASATGCGSTGYHHKQAGSGPAAGPGCA